jgi:hypothetical protein
MNEARPISMRDLPYGDFHVDWQNMPSCGMKADNGPSDNIYCRRAGALGDPIMGPPMDSSDTVLLPAADFKSAPAR